MALCCISHAFRSHSAEILQGFPPPDLTLKRFSSFRYVESDSCPCRVGGHRLRQEEKKIDGPVIGIDLGTTYSCVPRLFCKAGL
jgi:hypothetical protein